MTFKVIYQAFQLFGKNESVAMTFMVKKKKKNF